MPEYKGNYSFIAKNRKENKQERRKKCPAAAGAASNP
jgi:hypothetical protein